MHYCDTKKFKMVIFYFNLQVNKIYFDVIRKEVYEQVGSRYLLAYVPISIKSIDFGVLLVYRTFKIKEILGSILFNNENDGANEKSNRLLVPGLNT